MVTRTEEKGEELNAFSASLCDSQTGCSYCTETLSWKKRTGSRMEPHNPGGKSQ